MGRSCLCRPSQASGIPHSAAEGEPDDQDAGGARMVRRGRLVLSRVRAVSRRPTIAAHTVLWRVSGSTAGRFAPTRDIGLLLPVIVCGLTQIRYGKPSP